MKNSRISGKITVCCNGKVTTIDLGDSFVFGYDVRKYARKIARQIKQAAK